MDVAEQVAMDRTPVVAVPGLPDQIWVGIQGALGFGDERSLHDDELRWVGDPEQVEQPSRGRIGVGIDRHGRPGAFARVGVRGLRQAVLGRQVDAVLGQDLPPGLVAGHLAGRSRLEDGHHSGLQLDALQPG